MSLKQNVILQNIYLYKLSIEILQCILQEKTFARSKSTLKLKVHINDLICH